MDTIIFTPRLKLTLVTEASKGSPEFEWFNEIWTDEKATWWSLSGQAKTTEDIERTILRYLPNTPVDNTNYTIVYAVHLLLNPDQAPTTPTQFIGFANLKPVIPPQGLLLPEHLTLPTSEITSQITLPLELAYMFLPTSWNQGHATEALSAILQACIRMSPEFWKPYRKVYLRAIVNALNPASSRVLEKVGVGRKGVHEWKGEAIFLAGEWRTRDDLVIHGRYLIE